jgi:hypothetical protein
MTVTFPLTAILDKLAYHSVGFDVPSELRRTELFGRWREYGRDLERDLILIAPRWLAWLYRWLPRLFSYHEDDDDGTWFLWAVAATRWRIGWLPARRKPEYGALWAIVRVTVCSYDWVIPI